MTNIKFRGKRVDNGEWAYDVAVLPFMYSTKLYGPLNQWREIEVDSSTVGQYTGLKDKSGKEIYTDDIVSYGGENYKVVFEQRNGCAYFGIAISKIETWKFCYAVPAAQMEVVGNIYDNE